MTDLKNMTISELLDLVENAAVHRYAYSLEEVLARRRELLRRFTLLEAVREAAEFMLPDSRTDLLNICLNELKGKP